MDVYIKGGHNVYSGIIPPSLLLLYILIIY